MPFRWTPINNMEKILPGIPDITTIRLERDALISDLKTLKSSLISLRGNRVDREKSVELDTASPQVFIPILPEIEQPADDSTTVETPLPIDQAMGMLKSVVVARSPPPTKHRPKISSVLVQPETHRSNQADEQQLKAILEIQRSDKQTMTRNKRMFGMLMGTLQRFKNEEIDREQVTKKRSKIEEKLEIAVEEEKASVTKEVARMIELKQSKEDLLSKIELKIDLVERFKNWDKSHRHLARFLKTETKPKLCWIPREHISDTEKKQKEIKDYWGICYAEKTAKFKRDMEEVEKSIEEHSRLHSILVDNNNIKDC